MLEPVGLRGSPTNTLKHRIFIALVVLRLGSYVQMGRYLYEYGLIVGCCFHQYKFVYYDVRLCQ